MPDEIPNAEDIWQYDLHETSFLDLHRYRMMRLGYLSAIQEIIDMLESRCNHHPQPTSQNFPFGHRCAEHTDMKNILVTYLDNMKRSHHDLVLEANQHMELFLPKTANVQQ